MIEYTVWQSEIFRGNDSDVLYHVERKSNSLLVFSYPNIWALRDRCNSDQIIKFDSREEAIFRTIPNVEIVHSSQNQKTVKTPVDQKWLEAFYEACKR